jgi:hypothetical protein
LLQASEGGSVSLGRRKFRSKSDATPTLKPKFEAAPNAIAGKRADNIPRAGAITPVSSPTTTTTAMPMVELSKTSLAGICLIAFACGIVTTVLVDRAVPRSSDRDAVARDPDSLPLRTTNAPSGDLQETPARAAPVPVAPPAPIFRAAAASAPVATRPRETAAAITPASEEAVVVQMPSPGGPAKLKQQGTAHGAHAAAVHNPTHQHSSATTAPPKGKRTVASAAKPPASNAAKPPVAPAEKLAAGSTTKPGAAKSSVASASKPAAGKPPSRPARSAGAPPKPGWIDPFSQ